MKLHNKGVLFSRSKEIFQREGLLSVIKQVFLFLMKSGIGSLFSYRIYYIYEKTLNETNKIEFVPKIQNVTLKIIHTPSEVDTLIVEGFDFRSYSSLEDLKEGLSKGAILFGVFIERELAHTSWVAMSNTTAIYDLVFQRMNYHNAGYIGPCNTNPVYRGLEIYPYVLSQICKFLKKKEKSKALINTSKSNLPSIRGIAKAKFKVCGEACYLKLILWEFWRLKKLKETKQ